jgi:hypothetical protein
MCANNADVQLQDVSIFANRKDCIPTGRLLMGKNLSFKWSVGINPHGAKLDATFALIAPWMTKRPAEVVA